MSKTHFTTSDDGTALKVERTFKTTQSKLWKAYTTQDMLDRWFAPTGWECTTSKHDFSDGGEWVYMLKCVDKEQADFYGMEMPGKLIYSDINPEDSFAYTDQFLDENGEVDESMPGSKTIITFTDKGDGTVHLTSETTYASPEALRQVLEMGMKQGLDESYDKLDALLTAAK